MTLETSQDSLYKGILVNEILRETILHSTFVLAARIAMRIGEPLASLRLSEEGLPTRDAISLFSPHVASFLTRNHALVLRQPAANPKSSPGTPSRRSKCTGLSGKTSTSESVGCVHNSFRGRTAQRSTRNVD
jgi:hypothetical protein